VVSANIQYKKKLRVPNTHAAALQIQIFLRRSLLLLRETRHKSQ
jgi:hypothetical protein